VQALRNTALSPGDLVFEEPIAFSVGENADPNFVVSADFNDDEANDLGDGQRRRHADLRSIRPPEVRRLSGPLWPDECLPGDGPMVAVVSIPRLRGRNSHGGPRRSERAPGQGFETPWV